MSQKSQIRDGLLLVLSYSNLRLLEIVLVSDLWILGFLLVSHFRVLRMSPSF